MPEDKNVILDDIMMDMDIETISLDDIKLDEEEELKESPSIAEKSEETPVVSVVNDIEVKSTPQEQKQEENVTDESPMMVTESEESIDIDNLDIIENTPEPAIPEEGLCEVNIEEAQSYPVQNVVSSITEYASERDIVTIEGGELDKLLYGEITGVEESTTKESSVVEEKLSPEDKSIIDNIPVVEEVSSFEEMSFPLEEESKGELLEISELKPREFPGEIKEEKKEEEFTFDLSVIPDVSVAEEDEPIALSLEELNNIEVSESNVIDYKTPEAPPTEEESVEISMEELDRIESDIKSGEKILPEAYSIEEAGEKERKEKIINEKLENLSDSTREELKKVLKYLDSLLESLPEEKIKEFAHSEYYDLYNKILDKLGI